MRKGTVVGLLVAATFAAGCSETPFEVERSGLEASGPSLAVSTGESFAYVTITNPSSSSTGMSLGSSMQMEAKLVYSKGGSLPSDPYASWRSTDPCVATVTSSYPNFGGVEAVKSGTAKIIVEVWGQADTVTVNVNGSDYPSAACHDAQWSWDYSDVSFTDSPANSYYVARRETLQRVVLFAGPKPDYTIPVGNRVKLVSEMWYSKGGKLSGLGYVSFSVSDASVAKVNNKGVVVGLKPGRTRVTIKLGQFTDEVPLYVK